MSTAEGSGGSSSPEAVALGGVLTFFGIVADHAVGAPAEEGERVASLAAGMAGLAGLPHDEIDALYFAARLRNVGALGNTAFAKGEHLPDRAAAMLRWDIPADGARICERLAALPRKVPDMVRWQAEAWDGTGYPDQLRWSGIPQSAALLHIACAYAAVADPDEALAAITAESGRTFAPEQVRGFVTWFHLHGGEIELAAPPYHALDASRTQPMHAIEMLAERVDSHNGTPLRAQRIARRAAEIGRALDLDAEEMHQIRLASLTFGAGELRASQLESAQFDPLARLGIEARATHAVAAADLVERCDFLRDAAPALRARAEWFDGTGRPGALRDGAIPRAGRVLAVAIAFDALDESYRSRVTEERTLPIVRLETAAGTQFDPALVRALAGVVKAHA